MSVPIEKIIKSQYAKLFHKNDWRVFKSAAEYYLETAAKLTTKDIKYEAQARKVLRRNIQKRLYIGIACELLLKSLYLKHGYCINKPKKGSKNATKYPYRFSQIKVADFDTTDTLTFNTLMDGLYKILDFESDKSAVDKGFRIAKVFRNKEGHVVVPKHVYDPVNYRDIETGVSCFYNRVFSECLKIRFSVGQGEKAEFRINKIFVSNV